MINYKVRQGRLWVYRGGMFLRSRSTDMPMWAVFMVMDHDDALLRGKFPWFPLALENAMASRWPTVKVDAI